MSTKLRGDRVAPYVLAAPFFVLLLAMGILPTIFALWTSVHQDLPMGGTKFSGTSNWVDGLTDRRFLPALANVSTYIAIYLPTILLLVCSLSLLAHARAGRFSSLMRFAWYLPGAVAGAAAALLALFMITPQLSPFTPLLDHMDVTSGTDVINALGLPVVLTIIAIAINGGGWIVVLYAALNMIPYEILESARMDGANAWQLARHIKLPAIRGQMSLMLIASFAYGSQVFVEPEVLRAAFPISVGQTWSVNQLAYYFATERGDFGISAALALTLLVVAIVVAVLVVVRTRLYDSDGEVS